MTKIAFDIDGTLVDADNEKREEMHTLIQSLAAIPSIELYVWSGGGLDYCERRVREFGLQNVVRLVPKFKAMGMDVCFDDEEVSLARVNIRV